MPLPNCSFNVDAEAGHAFGIFTASFGVLRAARCALRRQLTLALGPHIMRTLSLRLFLLATLVVATGAHAAPLNKCVINGSVSYQQTPCPSARARKDPTLEELNAAQKKRQTTSTNTAPTLPQATRAVASMPPAAISSYRCDGRKHCSQMSSCAEAKFFLSYCPGVKMDGDNDGIPCEDQWCSP